MAKRKKQIQKEQPKPRGISKRGKKTIAAGIFIVIVGFFVLSFADPSGENFAAHLSPFLLIAGYATIGIGIILPEKDHEQKHAPA